MVWLWPWTLLPALCRQTDLELKGVSAARPDAQAEIEIRHGDRAVVEDRRAASDT